MRIVKADKEVPADITGNERIVKVNIPHCWEGFRSGSGEGVWGYIRRAKDKMRYDRGVGEFELVLLNTSIYWPQLVWGSVILAEGRGTKRPVLAKAMFEQLMIECGSCPQLQKRGSTAH